MSSQRHATVVGLGSVLPERIVSNEWFESFIDTSDEWIRERTGIRERHYALDGQTTSDLATDATRRALEAAAIAPEQIDLLVCATLTGDTPIPSTAVWVQRKLGITAPAFDVNAACAGFSYALIDRDGVHRVRPGGDRRGHGRRDPLARDELPRPDDLRAVR